MIKKIPLRNLMYPTINHVKYNKRMFIINPFKEFTAEYGVPAGYNNFLNDLENGIETIPVAKLADTSRPAVYQMVQNNEIIKRDNSELIYEARPDISDETSIKLMSAAKIYGLDYEVEIDVKFEHAPKEKKASDRVPSDNELNAMLGHLSDAKYGQFGINYLKNADIINGKVKKRD